jgi:hypothetical protein
MQTANGKRQTAVAGLLMAVAALSVSSESRAAAGGAWDPAKVATWAESAPTGTIDDPVSGMRIRFGFRAPAPAQEKGVWRGALLLRAEEARVYDQRQQEVQSNLKFLTKLVTENSRDLLWFRMPPDVTAPVLIVFGLESGRPLVEVVRSSLPIGWLVDYQVVRYSKVEMDAADDLVANSYAKHFVVGDGRPPE